MFMGSQYSGSRGSFPLGSSRGVGPIMLDHDASTERKGLVTSGCPEDHRAYTHPYLFRHGKSPVLSLRTGLAMLGADVFVTRFLLLQLLQIHGSNLLALNSVLVLHKFILVMMQKALAAIRGFHKVNLRNEGVGA